MLEQMFETMRWVEKSNS